MSLPFPVGLLHGEVETQAWQLLPVSILLVTLSL